MKPVIKVENLSKQYRLGDVGTGSIKDDIKRWRYKMMGKEDPFLMVGEENDRTISSKSNYVWALKDINFEVQQGDILGIIGRNGAGKSTLLKILSRTTGPTTGSVKMKGRIASLLEVGTGFHGELSGRENIYLNGAIMGLRKHEIKQKLDEIIDFAGVERYIDTPVKRYSSGMYVRLAFAVAAHLEPDIMIVDEVLAVGDADFQKKALGKLKDVSKNDGRTVLFVSHNMAALKNICKKGLLIQNGKIQGEGQIDLMVEKYLQDVNQNDILQNGTTFFGEGCKIENASISCNGAAITNGEDLILEIRFEGILEQTYSIIFSLNRNEQCVFASASFYKEELLKTGVYNIILRIPKYLLNPGYHSLDINIVDETGNFKSFLHVISILSFTIVDDMVRRGNKYSNSWEGAVSPILPIEWEKL